jgi:PTH1 family peptidyl-tRNA hydrolase
MVEQERWMIVGLGNPGRKYQKSRHNVGFQCVDRIARAHQLAFDKRKSKGHLALGHMVGHPVILLKPQTYMNDSGQSVGPVARFYRVPMTQIMVIYDELDLALGSVRLRGAGGSGGHKGMRSIIDQLGGQDFPRLRVGIGRPPGRMDPAAYVLQDFSDEENGVLAEVFDWTISAIECWLTEGIDIAMTRFNRTSSEQE